MPEGLCMKPWADLNLKMFASIVNACYYKTIIINILIANLMLWMVD